MKIRININGEVKEVRRRTVAGLFEELKIDPTGRSVVVNGLSVKLDAWPQAAIHKDDKIEIIRNIAGG